MKNLYSTEAFEQAYTYHGSDLGAVWSPDATAFRLWAPSAAAVTIHLYASGNPECADLLRCIPMKADINGTWKALVEGDLNGIYYTYCVEVDGKTVEACDPYARTTGVNGKRAMVLRMETTNPEGWEADCDPNAGKRFTDAVIYELHVRDLSIESHSGIRAKGKFLGVIEPNTHTKTGIPTGLAHMKQLGITHLHLLPIYDYGSVDEAHLDKPQFNWGYDPVNYNIPEGSYSTDPFHGEVRVSEMKQMVKGLHDNGISVIMDVVYNHVYRTEEFCFNQIVPGYFSRFNVQGDYSNGSCCGNDTASERSMVRKYIVDSVNYWADEYHIDGFRFDLVGLIDTQTITELMQTVQVKHPNVVFYGEGWDIPSGVTKPNVSMTIQRNADLVPGFAFFNDSIRDGLRGSVFGFADLGFISGKTADDTLRSCFRGATWWTKNPGQIINYASCHDNHTLYDRIAVALPKAERSELVRRNNLAAAFVLMSQGIPFLHAGEEMLRSKPGRNHIPQHNSYNAPDKVNSIKWNTLNDADVMETLGYYQGLIAIRKAFPILRMTDSSEIDRRVTDVPSGSHAMAFLIEGCQERLFIAFNADSACFSWTLPDGDWDVLAEDNRAGTVPIRQVRTAVSAAPLSALILRQAAPSNEA